MDSSTKRAAGILHDMRAQELIVWAGDMARARSLMDLAQAASLIEENSNGNHDAVLGQFEK